MRLSHRSHGGVVRHGDGPERGVAVVEFALVAGLLVLLVFGALDTGFHFRATHEAVGASRAGSRIAAGLGQDRTADYYALTTVRASLESVGMSDSIERVVIYRANSEGRPPPSCTAASPSGACNVYPGSALSSLSLAHFNAQGCAPTRASHSGWCPSARNTDQPTSDYVGVMVVLGAPSVTGMFPDRSINRRSVMRMEPSVVVD